MAVYSRVIRGPLNSKKHNRLLPPHSHLLLPLPIHDKIPATIKRRHNLSSKNFNPPPLFTLYTIRFPPRTTAMNNPQSTLPPGFRFHPTDEELIFHYLSKKVTSTPFPDSIIAEVDIYKFDPWDLPGKAVFGEKEWYFFSPRDRKYPNGVRPNRAAASGYWKATGTDKTIIASASEGGHANIGVKKALVFYQGKPPKGIKTNWIMHEYRIAQPANTSINKPPLKLRDASMRLDDWVLCRIYKKSNAVPPSITAAMDDDQEQEDSFMEESLKSHHNPSTIQEQKPPSLSNMLDAMDSSVFGHLFSDIQYSDSTTAFGPSPTVNYGSFCQSNDILPNLTPWNSEAQNMANQLKRQRSNIDGDVPCPSKKLTMSSAFTTNPNQSDLPQSYFNPSLFNQALLLNPNYHHFQG